ncbi:hypothetical protein PM035_17175, partial [Halorubrum ezzemoulense]|uniref:hypothetical protein n=1 Tax=Halorubrum ezzemoulense TaxID=337243 RepID=UPI00232BB05B
GENDSAIVGGVGDATYTADDDVTLYPGSTLTVAYCEDGDEADGDWLTDGDGFDLGERTGHTYTVTITGENVSGESEVDFADHLAEGEEPPSEGRFAVSVVGGGAEEDDSLGVGDEEIEETYGGYLRNVGETEHATAALNETTSAIDAGESEPSDANKTVYS